MPPCYTHEQPINPINIMPYNDTTSNYFHNPIQILHQLEDAGFTKKQAETQIEVFVNHVGRNLVTKKDLKQELSELELKLSLKFKNVDLKLKELEHKLTVKTTTIVGSIVGFFYLLEKFF